MTDAGPVDERPREGTLVRYRARGGVQLGEVQHYQPGCGIAVDIRNIDAPYLVDSLPPDMVQIVGPHDL